MLIIAITLIGCTDDTEVSPEEAAEDVLDLLFDGDIQAIYDEWFDEELQEAMTLDDLENNWGKLVESSGEFVGVSSLEEENRTEDLTVIEANVEYTNILFDVRMIFNERADLVGFSLSDAVQNVRITESIIEEEIIVGEGSAYELGGTLTLPKENQKRLPAVVLVQGSGPSDRDETVFAYKPFRDIAWGLAEQGIAVIRYDKRTFAYEAEMKQDISQLTVYEETVEDAVLAAELIKNDDRINENQVYLIGHSLGGMLAPRIDIQGGNYAGLIILAGSPRTLWEVVYDQNKDVIENYVEDESAKEQQENILEEEYEKAQQLQDMTDDEAKKTDVFGINGYYLKDMDEYNVASIVSELEKPLLLLQGEDDFQVYYEKDFVIWQEVLEGHDDATFISYPGLNHFFVDYEGPNEGTIAEYETPNQVDEEVIHDIGEWILEKQD